MPISAIAVHEIETFSVELVKLTSVEVSPLVINWFSSENSTWGEGSTVIVKTSVSPSQLTSFKV